MVPRLSLVDSVEATLDNVIKQSNNTHNLLSFCFRVSITFYNVICKLTVLSRPRPEQLLRIENISKEKYIITRKW